ncbi:MAG TPA: ElyC/SanA/YdcF family protein [Verrucomicrobiae bacterium]|jgi:hypothetical protein|nr:ElyC/SanA/YdcF family protein [Verrucomicrobiae bacterium]
MNLPDPGASPGAPLDSKFWGTLTRQPRWGLSWRGRFALLAIIVILGGVFVLKAHDFLAVTHRVDTNILVVEGWIENYALRAAVVEFTNGGYHQLYTTGGPIVGDGGYSNDYRTSASVGAEQLIKLGMPRDRVQLVATHEIGRDRTYQSAVALRDWFRAHHLEVRKLNVLTEDAHGRRSRLLYEMAFGRDVEIGIISEANPDYDPARWWRYSAGVREIISEATAYLYARIFFHPPRPAN